MKILILCATLISGENFCYNPKKIDIECIDDTIANMFDYEYPTDKNIEQWLMNDLCKVGEE